MNTGVIQLQYRLLHIDFITTVQNAAWQDQESCPNY